MFLCCVQLSQTIKLKSRETAIQKILFSTQHNSAKQFTKHLFFLLFCHFISNIDSMQLLHCCTVQSKIKRYYPERIHQFSSLFFVSLSLLDNEFRRLSSTSKSTLPLYSLTQSWLDPMETILYLLPRLITPTSCQFQRYDCSRAATLGIAAIPATCGFQCIKSCVYTAEVR